MVEDALPILRDMQSMLGEGLLIPKPVDARLKLILSTSRIDARRVQRFMSEKLSQPDKVVCRLLQVTASEGMP